MADFLYLSLNDSKLFSISNPAVVGKVSVMGKPIFAILAGEGANIINEANGFIASPNNINELKAIIKNALKSTEIEKEKIWEIMENFLPKVLFINY